MSIAGSAAILGFETVREWEVDMLCWCNSCLPKVLSSVLHSLSLCICAVADKAGQGLHANRQLDCLGPEFNSSFQQHRAH